MWPWPSITSASLIGITLIFWSPTPPAFAAPTQGKTYSPRHSTAKATGAEGERIEETSVGPTSDEEAKILVEDGKKAFESGDYTEAISRFERLVARYPAYPGRLDAYRDLGISYLRLGNPKKALEPLKTFVSASGDSLESDRARLELARAYIDVSKPAEASLVTFEILEHDGKQKRPTDLRAHALLLKAEALIAQDDDARALQALESARHDISPDASVPSTAPSPDDKSKSMISTEPGPLFAQASWLSLKLKVRACARLPLTEKSPPVHPGEPPRPKVQMDEGQVKSLMQRRATCLQESLLILKETLATNQTQWAAAAELEEEDAFTSYWGICRSPPAAPGKRTPLQQKRYRAELADSLIKDCKARTAESLSIIDGWKGQLPSPMQPQLEALRKRINHLLTRKS